MILQDSGLLTTEDAKKSGISKYKFYKFLEENQYEKIGHGICAA